MYQKLCGARCTTSFDKMRMIGAGGKGKGSVRRCDCIIWQTLVDGCRRQQTVPSTRKKKKTRMLQLVQWQ